MVQELPRGQPQRPLWDRRQTPGELQGPLGGRGLDQNPRPVEWLEEEDLVLELNLQVAFLHAASGVQQQKVAGSDPTATGSQLEIT